MMMMCRKNNKKEDLLLLFPPSRPAAPSLRTDEKENRLKFDSSSLVLVPSLLRFRALGNWDSEGMKPKKKQISFLK